MMVRVFQMVTAAAEINRATGDMVVRHGAYWRHGYHACCEWSSRITPQSIDGARERIAEHLNECPHFEWPLLPSPGYDVLHMYPADRPRLTARDVLPGTNLDTNERLHFGVTTSEFSVAGIDDRITTSERREGLPT